MLTRRGTFKGLRFQYRIVYDIEVWRRILQVVADAVYELAEKHEVGVEERCRYGMSGIPLHCEYHVFVDGVRVEAGDLPRGEEPRRMCKVHSATGSMGEGGGREGEEGEARLLPLAFFPIFR
jgi:hypothetical protein